MATAKAIKKEDLTFCKNYIKSVRWQEAKTYKSAPHSYTVREWDYDKGKDFVKFVKLIRKYGYIEYFWRKPFTYLEIGNYKYWTMGAPIEETILINRASK